MKVYIGCDPGMKGAICALGENRNIIFKDYTENTLDIARWLEDVKDSHEIQMCMIEDVHSIFGASAKSNFNFGKNTGILHGVIRALALPLDLIQPKKWQKAIGTKKKSGPELKKEIGSIAQRLYPTAELHTPRGRLLDGRADALMIAHYCKLQYTGKLS